MSRPIAPDGRATDVEPARSPARRAGSAAVALTRSGARRVHAWNQSGGAAGSGLARLVEVHAMQTAGDAFVTVALAGSLFFSVPTHEARTRVGLYLLIAMAPFAVVAPVLGPMLDRFQHGRRFALAATMLVRATLALVIGRALASGHLSTADAFALYPAALGVLVAQKTYVVARGATVPRVLPTRMTLVQANSRLTLVGVVAPTIAASVALVVSKLGGHQWTLRVGAVVYLVAAVFALRLPRHADGGRETRRSEQRAAIGSPLKLGQLDRQVAAVLRSSATLRWLAGFLLFYGAFVVQEHSVGGLPRPVALAALAIGIGIGNVAGTAVGVRADRMDPNRVATSALVLTVVVTLLTALDFALLTVFALAVVSSAASALVKLGLDATIQHRTAEQVRTTMFGRSETALQLAWVLGGVIGIALPTRPTLGFTVATAVLAAALLAAVTASRRARANGSG